MNSVDISAATWRRSLRSMANGNCVEVADLGRDHVGVRDSKDVNGPALVFSKKSWAEFAGSVKRGQFDV
ncbi:DUF397 domain-containing protein [Bailinhaonella thermotolerans]|uniref:DUF397 domain-containing protein n=1 Tax=Bailinhaonella thermotolerans TaxID=1070861 RepID=A0A3A4A7V6_9ACTN|nr:DUF397 domain-containing protein [Bailinhaonella thermotolerans]RJL24111.1 DUF397 domain-containing protein [Bailinhaonella thermotolerans]